MHRLIFRVVVFLSGASALGWEVLWQHHTALAFGVSAYGTAVTLACLMAGLGLGGYLAHRWEVSGRITNSFLFYGFAEAAIGVGGLFVPVGLRGLTAVDSWLYAQSPLLAMLTQVIATAVLLIVPASAMGLTLPLLIPLAKKRELNIGGIYALNVLGAVLGVLLATFLVLPLFGVRATAYVAAGMNFSIATWAFSKGNERVDASSVAVISSPIPAEHLLLAFVSGFTTFCLEVSWFRSLRAAMQSTTEAFAAILAAFLLALSFGGVLASWIKKRWPEFLVFVLPLCILGILVATPFVDQMDRYTTTDAASLQITALRFVRVLLVVVLPIALLGIIFPWLLEIHDSTSGSGRLYAINTLGAIAGSLCAGFVLLPNIGATRTSWLASLLLLPVALYVAQNWRYRVLSVCAAAAALIFAWSAGSKHSASAHVQGFRSEDYGQVLFLSEGPDSTVWVSKERRGNKALVIDGFTASGEGAGTRYMAWMSHLPALAARRLERALVICFGTGQTANALKKHRPTILDIADVNPAVFRAAPFFQSNEGVLHKPGVNYIVMDGRAFLRRSKASYDVVTLEPMPPNFAGSNHLYSLEFYQLVRANLSEGGMAAQWVPFHLISSAHMRSIIATFVKVFPYSRLWIDPEGTGILVGGLKPWQLKESQADLPLDSAAIAKRFELNRQGLMRVSKRAQLITDDNQLLSFGFDRLARNKGNQKRWFMTLVQKNHALLRRYK
ncbi:MAG: fused MFS/spermidine synthase [Myxococcales bacterium]|nr:MAG: fused MFS/spermidine synthase [Myxococcales bacterium]